MIEANAVLVMATSTCPFCIEVRHYLRTNLTKKTPIVHVVSGTRPASANNLVVLLLPSSLLTSPWEKKAKSISLN